MKILIGTLALACVVSGFAAPNYGPQPTPATIKTILQLREQAWRSWFGNDVSQFKQLVPNELVAIGWGGGEFSDRAGSLQQMTEFAASQQVIETLSFPKNVFQQYGEVVILYTEFDLTLRKPDGQRSRTKGRGSEIFVLRGGRWIHTGWHLDAVGTEPKAQ